MYTELSTESLIEMWQDTKNLNIKRDIELEVYDRNKGFRCFALKSIMNPKYNEKDYHQEVYFLILKAIEQYDSKRNVPFSSFVAYYIRSSIDTFNRSHALVSKPKKHDGKLLFERVTSIHAKKGKKRNLSLEDQLRTNDKNPEELTIDTKNKELCENILSKMGDRERMIFMRAYGFYGKKESPNVMAVTIGVTGERIRQIIEEKIEKLKGRFKVKEFIRENKV